MASNGSMPETASRSAMIERTCASTTSPDRSPVRTTVELARPSMTRWSRAASAIRPAASSSATSSAQRRQVAAERRVADGHRLAAVARHGHASYQHPGVAQREVHRLDQLGHRPDRSPVPQPERRRGHAPTALRRRRPGARGSARRWCARPASRARLGRRRRPRCCRPRPAAAPRSCVRRRAACSRGLRNGALGTTVAATSATAPPIRASVQRVNAAPGSGSSVLTTIDCTAAWVTKIWPASSSSAVLMASETISAICQAPVPIRCVIRSPRNTPTATPRVTSPTRRSR